MERQFGFRRTVAVFIIVALAVVGGILWYRSRSTNSQTTSSATSSSTDQNISCAESSEYFIIDNNPGQPGLDLIIKHKTSPDETFPCVFVAVSSGFILQNNLPEYFLGLTQNFLILDSGTAPPPRGLEVYNLDTQKSIFTDTYSPPVSVSTGTITYWEKTDQVVTSANCPDLNEYTTDGLGAIIESQVTLDLSTLAKKKLGGSQCVPTQ